MELTQSDLWRDATELPESLADSLDRADGHRELAEAIAARAVRRLVLSGNGASWYAANAGWLAALDTAVNVEVLTVPAGILASRGFRWREGDFLLAISSSGSLRDLLEAIEDPRLPRPFGLITADDTSPLARAAAVRALMTVRNQRALTHSQAYLGSVLTLIDLLGRLAGDRALRAAARAVPDILERQLHDAPAWSDGALRTLERLPPRAAVSFGTGPGWAAAQEVALLLKEVAGIPSEGVETREGATTGMYALDSEQLVVALLGSDDRLIVEAAAVCAGRGARVVESPWPIAAEPRLAAAVHFVHPLALAIELALAQGISPDLPSWSAAYHATARRAAGSEEHR